MNFRKKIQPGPGQESVWDYPRPPRVEDSTKHIQVILNGVVIADSHRAKRVLETSHPPVYYIPPEDMQMQYFKPTPRTTFCEFKGAASYYTITVGDKIIPNGAWYYAHPTHPYEALQGYIALYPGKMDICTVNGEQVQAQEGDFYGGWITKDIVGPFKGGMGTFGW
ncbi:MAG: DUF427 domain-containing protein [Ktedonobacteraceae bacterium]